MPLNYSRYCNQEADSAMNAERLTTDPAARKAAWKRLADRAHRQALVYLFHRRLLWAYSQKLTGFGEYPDGLVRFTGLKLD